MSKIFTILGLSIALLGGCGIETSGSDVSQTQERAAAVSVTANESTEDFTAAELSSDPQDRSDSDLVANEGDSSDRPRYGRCDRYCREYRHCRGGYRVKPAFGAPYCRCYGCRHH